MKIARPLHSNKHITSFIIHPKFHRAHPVEWNAYTAKEQLIVTDSNYLHCLPWAVWINDIIWFFLHLTFRMNFYEWKRLKRCVRVYCCWICEAYVVHTKYIGLVTTKSWMNFQRCWTDMNEVTVTTTPPLPSSPITTRSIRIAEQNVCVCVFILSGNGFEFPRN